MIHVKEAVAKLAGLHSDSLRSALDGYAILSGLPDEDAARCVDLLEGLLAARPKRKERVSKKPKTAPAAKAA